MGSSGILSIPMRFFDRLRNQKKTPYTIPLASALELVGSELKESTEKRIRRPFESPVTIGSITEADLVQWGNLDIELVATCPPRNFRSDKRIILLTGKPSKGGPDWPDIAVEAKKKADKNELLARQRQLGMAVAADEPLSEDEQVTAKGIKAARAIFDERMLSPLAYILHNHPNRNPRPSFADIENSAASHCEIEAIITPPDIVFYTARPEDVFELQLMDEAEQNEYIDSKIIKARIPLSDPRMKTVLDFFNQKISWQKAQRILTR
jgi:proteasome lid subunit RPN8/RPN11